MPRRTKKRRRTPSSRRYKTRRSYRRRRSGFAITSRQMPTLFPDQTIVRLKTDILQTVTTTTNGSFAFTLYANSLADPMGTISITAQPTGLDQLAAYYNRYYVAAAKVKFRLYPSINFEGAPRPWQIVTSPSMEILAEADYLPTGVIASTEQPYARWKEQFYTGGIGYVPTIYSFMTTHKISGGEFSKTNPACCGSIVGLPTPAIGAPTAPWFFNGRIEVLGAAVAQPCMFRVVMTQYACFFNRAYLPDSVQ